MNRRLRQVSFAHILAVLFVVGLTANSQAGETGCSDATYEGDYVFSGHGNTVVAGETVPFVFIGRLTADGKGNFSGTGTSSLNGQIIHRSYTATYRVNPDCTAYYSGTDSEGQYFQGEFIFAGPSGKRYRGLRTVEGQTIVFSGEKE
jgi:hypothetical protein